MATEITNDVRYTPDYYAYYYSQRPLDPRLPPPLISWEQNFYNGPNSMFINNAITPILISYYYRGIPSKLWIEKKIIIIQRANS